MGPSNYLNCLLSRYVKFAVVVILSLLISACASEQAFKSTKAQEPFDFHVVNNTNTVVDIVKYKPCGAPEDYYRNLATKIGPTQRAMSNVYDVCIDLVAVDIFNKVVLQKANYWMAQHATWQIVELPPTN